MISDVISACNLGVKHMSIGLVVALTSGCNISVPQAESSYKFVKDLILADDVSSKEQQAIWLASLGDRGAVLRPYLSGGLTVFANTDGDAIAFDGWTIRSVVGFGLKDPLSISGKDGVRTFTVAGKNMQTKCDEWSLVELSWSQICSNGTAEILLDGEGKIQKITMPVGDGSIIVRLRVAK